MNLFALLLSVVVGGRGGGGGGGESRLSGKNMTFKVSLLWYRY